MKWIIRTILVTLLISGCKDQERENIVRENHSLIISVDSLKLKLDSINKSPALLFQNAFQEEELKQQEAIRTYKALIQFDSNSFWAIQAKQRLIFLTSKKAQAEFEDIISGTWTWSETFTNWGQINSPINCNCSKKLIILDGKIAEFYHNDTLQRRTEIDIRTKPDWLGGALVKFIKFKDNEGIWQILISEDGKQLTFTEPDCECGCLTKGYIKK